MELVAMLVNQWDRLGSRWVAEEEDSDSVDEGMCVCVCM